MKKKSIEKIEELYIRVVKKLSSTENTNRYLTDILQDVCSHFSFGCGLIYQADHTNIFFLKEFFAFYEDKIQEVINLSDFLSQKEINELFGSPVFFSVKDDNSEQNTAVGGIKDKILDVFSARTLFMIPIKGDDGRFVGFVVLLDRRSRILLDDQNKDAARTVLTIVANFVKLRIYQQKIENTTNYLLRIMDHTGIDIYVTDFNTYEILYANKSMAAPYGGQVKMIGETCWKFLYDDKTGPCEFCPKKQLIDSEGNPSKLYTWDYQRPFDKSWFRVFSAAFRWVDGRLATVITSVDITENKRNEELIRQLAEYDHLTSLPNRRRVMTDCDDAIKRMKEKGQEGYVLFFDLDKFKQVNDTMGHQVGDDLLQLIGETLKTDDHTRGRAYRHGGDEFVVVCENADKKQVEDIVEYILERFRQPWQLKEHAPICHASIGIAHYPKDGEDTETLLNNADIAMYEAKRNGRNTAVYYDNKMKFS